MRNTCKKVLTFTPRTREGKKGGGQRKYLAQFLLHSPPQKHVGGGSVTRPAGSLPCRPISRHFRPVHSAHPSCSRVRRSGRQPPHGSQMSRVSLGTCRLHFHVASASSFAAAGTERPPVVPPPPSSPPVCVCRKARWDGRAACRERCRGGGAPPGR